MLVHGIFWNGLWQEGAPSILRSYVLIEMPLIFAAAGASNYLSPKRGVQLLTARLRRILIPYWVYALVCVILIFDQNGLVPRLLLSWMNPFANAISGDGRLQVLNWALWFIPVYLGDMLLFPLLKEFYLWASRQKKYPFLRMTPLFAGILVVAAHDLFSLPIPQFRTFFYLIFIYWGMVCMEHGWIGQKRRESAILACISLATLLLLLTTGQYGPDMLANKDQCNLIFLLYGFFSQCVLNFSLPLLSRIVRYVGQNSFLHRILSAFRDNGYSIYLYHTLIFAAIPAIVSYVGLDRIFTSGHAFLILSVYFFLLALLSPLLAKILGRIEHRK